MNYSIYRNLQSEIATLYRFNTNFLTFLDKCLEYGCGFNTMTRQLSGIEDQSNLRTFLYVPHESIVHVYTDGEMKKMLDEANLNIKKYFFVGSVENICSDFKILGKKIGKSLKLNVRRKTKKKEEVDMHKVYSMIEQLNMYDLMLYKWFNEQLIFER